MSVSLWDYQLKEWWCWCYNHNGVFDVGIYPRLFGKIVSQKNGDIDVTPLKYSRIKDGLILGLQERPNWWFKQGSQQQSIPSQQHGQPD